MFSNSGNNLTLGKIYFYYAAYYAWTNTDTTKVLLDKALSYFEKANRKDWLALTIFLKATNYTSLNNNAKALECFINVVSINKTIKSEFIAENIFCTRGYLYSSMAEHPKAMDDFLRGMKIAERIEDENMQAMLLNNIGTTVGEMGDLKKSRDYFEKLILLATKINDKTTFCMANQNIGWTYYYEDKFKDALTYADRALKIALEVKQQDHIAECYGLLGNINEKLGMYKSLSCFNASRFIANAPIVSARCSA